MNVSSDVQSLGWTPRRVGATVLLAMEEHRKAVGMRIRALRESQGLSQEDLAHRAGVTTKTISRWELGRNSGYGGNFKMLAEALGVEQREILGDQPAPLGLGAREDQVAGGFEEFRGYVREILERLDTADVDRAAITLLLKEQSALLAQQSELLDRLRETVRVLPAIDVLLRELDADAGVRELPPATAEEPSRGRRSSSRRPAALRLIARSRLASARDARDGSIGAPWGAWVQSGRVCRPVHAPGLVVRQT